MVGRTQKRAGRRKKEKIILTPGQRSKNISVYYNDNNAFCCKVLHKQVAAGNLPEGKIDERDIREITGEDLQKYRHIHLFAGIGGFPLGLKWAGWPESLSVVTGGFPCQPFSVAGKRKGTGDDRYLWPEMLRIIQSVRPEWVFAENVPGIFTIDDGLVIERVLSGLENIGYETMPPFEIPACAVDAKHRRNRAWIMAHSKCRSGNTGSKPAGREKGADINRRCEGSVMANTKSEQNRGIFERQLFSDTGAGRQDVADTESFAKGGLYIGAQKKITMFGECSQDAVDSIGQGLEILSCEPGDNEQKFQTSQRGSISGRWWEPEPGICRVAHGIHHRVDRLKALGNAVVPQVVEMIARCILHAKEHA
ncbi:MAG TPA: DNA cytosine methyltransferase [Desulfobacterales bacterium]|nr:DNA cytosine methyltransferase [Desulfobacterales bacterium]